MNLIPKYLRTFPHIREYNWLIHAFMIDFLEVNAEKYASGVMVDIGCGTKPYEPIFAPFVTKHIGIDQELSIERKNAKLDIIGDAYRTTLEDSSCNTVLFTEVLEHLEDPEKAIIEIHRILKKDGVIILTVPFFWQLHEEPRDFYRYTKHGLTYLFESHGFKIEEIKPLTGFIATFSQLMIYYFMSFKPGPIRWVFGGLFNYIVQRLAKFLDRYDHSYEFTNLYGMIARKI